MQFVRRRRFSPFNRRIFKPRAFGFHAPRLNAAPVPVAPVIPGRFRRPPSTIAPRCSAALWPARSRVPVVGLENRPASHVLHTNSFFRNHRGRRVRVYACAGVEPRPARSVRVESLAGCGQTSPAGMARAC